MKREPVHIQVEEFPLHEENSAISGNTLLVGAENSPARVRRGKLGFILR